MVMVCSGKSGNKKKKNCQHTRPDEVGALTKTTALIGRERQGSVLSDLCMLSIIDDDNACTDGQVRYRAFIRLSLSSMALLYS